MHLVPLQTSVFPAFLTALPASIPSISRPGGSRNIHCRPAGAKFEGASRNSFSRAVLRAWVSTVDRVSATAWLAPRRAAKTKTQLAVRSVDNFISPPVFVLTQRRPSEQFPHYSKTTPAKGRRR